MTVKYKKAVSAKSRNNNAASMFSLDRELLINIYRYYGFKECDDIYNFLEYVSHPIPGEAEIRFIAQRTRECLKRHDDGSRYFDELRAVLLFLEESLGN